MVAHSLLRWLVLVAVAARVGRGALGWATNAPYGRPDRVLGLVALILVDIQFTLGMVLFGVSPRVAAALADPGAAMKVAASRQVLVEHPVLMVAAIAAIHVGFALSKRGAVDRARHRAATLGFGVGAMLVVVGIPWR